LLIGKKINKKEEITEDKQTIFIIHICCSRGMGRVISYVCDLQCLSVHVLKRKWFKLSTPKLVYRPSACIDP